MPDPIEDNASLNLEDLQKAISEDAFGKRPVEQDEIEIGEDLTRPADIEEPEDRVVEPVEELDTEVPEEVQETAEEQVKEPVEEPEQVEPKFDKRVLSEEELKNTFVKGIVNGEEKEYSLWDLKGIQQTQDAATQWLERAKAEFKAERDAFKKEMESQPTPQADDEYLTDEEKRLRQYDEKIKEIEQHQRNFESNLLINEEAAYMESVYQRDGLTRDEFGQKLRRLVETDKDAAIFASKLFLGNPQNSEDLEERKSTFNILYRQAQNLEMPEVVQRVAKEAEEKGKTQAKIDAKRQLTDTSAGQVDMREPSRADKLRGLSKSKSDEEFVKFMLDNSVVLKNFDE